MSNQPSATDRPENRTNGWIEDRSEPRRSNSTDWIDRDAYPFESNFLQLAPGRLHYVDEGEGRPIVMLHGNGTWSFLYRELLKGLSEEYRCLAPDHFGFGLSDKPRSWSYRPKEHARAFETFVEELGLEDITLVVHDWGGPIGMDYATKHPENVRSIVALNTAAWPLDERLHVRAFAALAGGLPGRYLARRDNAFVKRGMPLAFGDRSRLTPELHRQYLEPLADPDDRKGTWVFPRELVGSTEWLADLWAHRDLIAEMPALLFWGLKDPLFRTAELRRWQALFPYARTVEYPDAGHFVPEEKGAEMATEIREFLAET